MSMQEILISCRWHWPFCRKTTQDLCDINVREFWLKKKMENLQEIHRLMQCGCNYFHMPYVVIHNGFSLLNEMRQKQFSKDMLVGLLFLMFKVYNQYAPSHIQVAEFFGVDKDDIILQQKQLLKLFDYNVIRHNLLLEYEMYDNVHPKVVDVLDKCLCHAGIMKFSTNDIVQSAIELCMKRQQYWSLCLEHIQEVITL